MMKEANISFKDILERIQEVVIVVGVAPANVNEMRIIYVNPAFTALTGYAAEEVIGYDPQQLQGLGINEQIASLVQLAGQKKEPIKVAVSSYARDGHQYWLEVSAEPFDDPASQLTYFVILGRDVTDQKVLEMDLEGLDQTDAVTGLLNRRSFFEYLEREWKRTQRYKTSYSLVLFTIDRFHSIYEEHGHVVSDMVLRILATQCQGLLRAQDIIGRIGESQFAILMPLTNLDGAACAAERLREAVEVLEVSTPTWSVKTTLSLSVAQVEETDTTVGALLKRADNALERAVQEGGNRVCKQ
jgi:diguanylate cyclase (GGDEF)-like protein/PAS domain S-box-containing protein